MSLLPEQTVDNSCGEVPTTEAQMLALLRQRYTEKAGNGDAYAFLTHVRDAAGFDGKRTCDAIAMSLWKSRGLELIGHEVKVSRSDWLRELKDPAKADGFCGLVDRWYLVAGDSTIVKDGELPPTWGLIVKRGNRLVCKIEAPPLRDLKSKPPISRSFLACLLKAAGAKASVEPEAIVEAREAGRSDAAQLWQSRLEHAEAEVERLRAERRAFHKASGVSLDWYSGLREDRVQEVGLALRLALNGNEQAGRLEERLSRIRAQAEAISQAALEVMEGRLA